MFPKCPPKNRDFRQVSVWGRKKIPALRAGQWLRLLKALWQKFINNAKKNSVKDPEGKQLTFLGGFWTPPRVGSDPLAGGVLEGRGHNRGTQHRTLTSPSCWSLLVDEEALSGKMDATFEKHLACRLVPPPRVIGVNIAPPPPADMAGRSPLKLSPQLLAEHGRNTGSSQTQDKRRRTFSPPTSPTFFQLF